MTEIKLPEKEYVQLEENGKKIYVCTLRQKAMHTIGLDHKKPYIRHGKQFYKPYRNYFTGNDNDLDKLVQAGYMDCEELEIRGEKVKDYWFNRIGLDWLGSQLGIVIRDVDD